MEAELAIHWGTHVFTWVFHINCAQQLEHLNGIHGIDCWVFICSHRAKTHLPLAFLVYNPYDVRIETRGLPPLTRTMSSASMQWLSPDRIAQELSVSPVLMYFPLDKKPISIVSRSTVSPCRKSPQTVAGRSYSIQRRKERLPNEHYEQSSLPGPSEIGPLQYRFQS